MVDDLLFTSASLEEALEQAALECNLSLEELDYEILEQNEDFCSIKVFLEVVEENNTPYFPTREDLTEEELDTVADTAIDILRSILVFFNAQDATIEEYEGDEGELILDVVGEDLAVLIGRHGRTLDALQSLVSAATNRALGFRYSIVIDVESYRNRQRQKIESLAFNAASRAVHQNRSIKLRPMTPYERRIVHMALRDDSRVETASEGREPNRQVVVTPL